MEKTNKKTKHKWIIIPAGFLLWSLIYTLLTFYQQPGPRPYTNTWNEGRMQVNLPSVAPISTQGE